MDIKAEFLIHFYNKEELIKFSYILHDAGVILDDIKKFKEDCCI